MPICNQRCQSNEYFSDEICILLKKSTAMIVILNKKWFWITFYSTISKKYDIYNDSYCTILFMIAFDINIRFQGLRLKSKHFFFGYRLSSIKVMRLGNTIVDKFRSFNHENLHLLNLMNMQMTKHNFPRSSWHALWRF